MVNIAAPIIGLEEKKAVQRVLQSGILAQGPKVSKLQNDFALYCGTKYAVALNSGTAALHCALFTVGIGFGDEVITTPFSFIATINPILMVGARPVLVDIEPQTFNIDISKIESAITKKTKAIIPVHLYGQPCDYAEIQALAKKHKLIVIEDACQAIGAYYGKKKAGSLGNLGCFSLYATKNIMSGEGGIVTTNSKKHADAIKRFRQHGTDKQYEYTHLGYNYRMSDLHAAVAVEQLKKVDKFNKARSKNAELLTKKLANIPGLELPITGKNRSHVFHQYTIRITPKFGATRKQLAESLKAKGVGSGIYYPKPLHAYSHIAKLGYKQGQFPQAELAAREVLSLPVHPKVTKADINLIVATIKKVARAQN